MVIITNTTEQKTNEVNYSELLVALKNKDFLEKAMISINNYRDRLIKNTDRWNSGLVLLYNNQKNCFELELFDSIPDWLFGPLDKTFGVGYHYVLKLVSINDYRGDLTDFLKSLDYPNRTLIHHVFMNSTVKNKLKSESDYTETLLKNTITHARKNLKDQFITIPLELTESIIDTINKKTRNYTNKSLILSVFPQFKSTFDKQKENTMIQSISSLLPTHLLTTSVSLTESIKGLIELFNAQTVSVSSKVKNNDFTKWRDFIINSFNWDSLDETVVQETLDFFAKDFLEKTRFLLGLCNRHSYQKMAKDQLMNELYYLVLQELTNKLDERPELKTPAVVDRLISLGAPFVNKNYKPKGELLTLSSSIRLFMESINRQSKAIDTKPWIIQELEKNYDPKGQRILIDPAFVVYYSATRIQLGFPLSIESLLEFFENNGVEFMIEQRLKKQLELFFEFANFRRDVINHPTNAFINEYAPQHTMKSDSSSYCFFKELMNRAIVIPDKEYEQGLVFLS